MFRAAVAACQPRHVLPPHQPEPPPGRTILLALGKGAAAAAEIVEAIWKGPLTGLAVAPHGTAARLQHIDLLTAGHPVPDAASVTAAKRLLALAGEAGPDDLVLVLLSGGASALACLPAPGLTVAEKQRMTEALLRSGAPISAINTVRRHLSAIKGGRLAAAAQPARLVTLAISDVVGDRPEEIGSGPTVADPTRPASTSPKPRSPPMESSPPPKAGARASSRKQRRIGGPTTGSSRATPTRWKRPPPKPPATATSPFSARAKAKLAKSPAIMPASRWQPTPRASGSPSSPAANSP
ncbi:MAG TPA: glycerate-2-kinase family protein [Allosphingosinicella sp.]